MKLTAYNISSVPYVNSGRVNLSEYCNGLTIRNTGSTTVTVNRQPLDAGAFMAISGNEGEIFRGRIDLLFAAAGNAGNEVWVTEKFYTSGGSYDTFGT